MIITDSYSTDVWLKTPKFCFNMKVLNRWLYLQQVEQMLISLQLLPFVFAERLETFVFVQGHHVRQLFFVLLGEFLMV